MMFVTNTENVDGLSFVKRLWQKLMMVNMQMKCIISFTRLEEALNEVLDLIDRARQIDKPYSIMLS